MQIIILSIHLVVCICLIGLVLLQRSEGGALGIGGGGGGSLMSGRGASDALARLTSIAGGLFLAVSLLLTWLSGVGSDGERSVFDVLPQAPAAAPVLPEAAPAPAEEQRPDPTESTAPQAQQTDLAAILPGPAPAAAAPPPATQQNAVAPINAARAAPLDTRQTVARTPAAQEARTPATQQTTAPATVRPPAAQQTAAQAPPRSQQQAPAAAPQQLQIPVSRPGAVNGVTLTEPAGPESVQTGNGLEAVRRERAGPDE